MTSQIPTSCYTYTCSNAATIASGNANYCIECFAMLDPFEAACKEIGVEAWDETFVLFRAGMLAGKAPEGQPSG